MTKQAKSKESIRASIMEELNEIPCCGAVNDVRIEVNWDRPAGLINWWVTRIQYQNTAFPQTDIAASGEQISRVEANQQARYFVQSNDSDLT